jgi:DegV family protein with EDD domain
VLTIAGRMSSTYGAACFAARGLGSRARVVDTETAAGAQALVVLRAAQRAREGATADEVERSARGVIDRVRLVATVASLDHLVASGRVPSIAGRAAHSIGVQPLFEFRRGRVRALRPALSRDASIERIIGLWRRSDPGNATLHVAALHACDPDRAQQLLDLVRAEVRPATEFVAEFSAVMVAHTGPQLAGLAWWWESAGEEASRA